KSMTRALHTRRSYELTEIRSAPVSTDENPELTKTEETTTREFEIDFRDTKWMVTIELSYDPDITDWLEVGSHVLANRTNNSTLRSEEHTSDLQSSENI